MPIALVCLGCMVFVTISSDVVLSVCIGVGDFGCPISLIMWRLGVALHEWMYRAPISASVAKDITTLIIWAMLSTSLLLGDTDDYLT